MHLLSAKNLLPKLIDETVCFLPVLLFATRRKVIENKRCRWGRTEVKQVGFGPRFKVTWLQWLAGGDVPLVRCFHLPIFLKLVEFIHFHY